MVTFNVVCTILPPGGGPPTFSFYDNGKGNANHTKKSEILLSLEGKEFDYTICSTYK